MSVPTLRLNIDDNPRIIVKQDTQPVVVTGFTVNLIGSGNTTVVGSGANWVIYSPTGGTAVWGSISGNIANQTDLYNILTGQTADILWNYQAITGLSTTLGIVGIALDDLTIAFTGHTGNTSIHTPYSAITAAISAATSGFTTPYTFTSSGIAVVSQTGQTVNYYVPPDMAVGWSGLTGLPTDNQDLVTLLSGYTQTGTTAQLQQDFSSHTGDTSIHYIMGDISISESQINDFGNYALESQLTGHTSNLTIHYPQSGISITESQVQGLVGKYTPTGTTAQLQSDLNTFSSNTYTLHTDSKEETGFINGSDIAVSYSYSARTVTLTGDLSYYWRGVKHTLASPFTSTAHAASGGTWFLSSTDGVNMTWSQTIWDFSDMQIAYLYYNASSATTFCIKETHGLIQHDAHETLHRSIGTIHVSGGAAVVGSFAYNTASDAATTPDFAQAVVRDEDLNVSIPEVVASGYTRMYVSGTTSVFDYAQNFPFYSTGSYIQVNNASTGAMTNGIQNRWYNVYQILIPVASDTESQKFRMVFLQPQVTFTSLAAALAEDTRALNLGSLSSQSAEYVIYARITYVTANGDGNTGKVRIPVGGMTYIVGNKMSQVSVAGISSSNHANLSNLDFASSGHIASTFDTLASFNSTGVAEELPKATFSLSGHSHSNYLTGGTNMGTGTTIFTGVTSQSLKAKSLTVTNLTITPTATQINIAAGSIAPKSFWTGTEAQYAALGSYDNNTLYFCT